MPRAWGARKVYNDRVETLEKSRNQRKLAQPPGLNPAYQSQSLPKEVSRNNPDSSQNHGSLATGYSDVNAVAPAKAGDIVTDDGRAISNITTGLLNSSITDSKLQGRLNEKNTPDQTPLQDWSNLPINAFGCPGPIPHMDRVKNFIKPFTQLNKSYRGDRSSKGIPSTRASRNTRGRPWQRRAGQGASRWHAHQSNRRVELDQPDPNVEWPTDPQPAGTAHSDNDDDEDDEDDEDQSETYEEYIAKKQLREKALADAESASIQEYNERWLLGDASSGWMSPKSASVDAERTERSEVNLLEQSPIKSSEKAPHLRITTPMTSSKSKNNMTGISGTKTQNVPGTSMASGTPASTAKGALATDKDYLRKQKFLKEKQLQALEEFRKSYSSPDEDLIDL